MGTPTSSAHLSLITSPNALLSNTITLGIRASTYGFGRRNTSIQFIAITLPSHPLQLSFMVCFHNFLLSNLFCPPPLSPTSEVNIKGGRNIKTDKKKRNINIRGMREKMQLIFFFLWLWLGPILTWTLKVKIILHKFCETRTKNFI